MPANTIDLRRLSLAFHPEPQAPRSLLSETVGEALQELLLHQIQLLRPDGISTPDRHLATAFGDGTGDGGDLLSHGVLPGRLQGCQWRLRRRLAQGGTQCARRRTRGPAPAHAAAASSVGRGSAN